jgi:flagellar biosynthesis protein
MSDRTDRKLQRLPLAVALHYGGRGAPRVVAKGAGSVAERIIATAREHDVPLQEDGALAAALARIELGREIPRELFVAVAHVLAFAWSVTGKRRVTVSEAALPQSDR